MPLPDSLAGISWRQPVIFVAATIICTLLAIYAVVLAPVAVTGVSGLYLAAAVYVPLALWFGLWGCFAGYLSCVFMGIYLNMPLPFVMVWALADFFEGFVPLLIYRSLRTRPVLELKRPKVTYAINGGLMVVLVAAAFALINSSTWGVLVALAASVALVVAQALVEDRKTWLTWLPIGVFIASLFSAIFGVGAMVAFGQIPIEVFSTAFFGWVLGDIIVLATIGTLLTVTFTPLIVKSKIYVRRYLS